MGVSSRRKGTRRCTPRRSSAFRVRATARVERRIVAAAPHAVKHVRPVAAEEATGLVAAVYRQVAEDFQITAPLVLHSPVPQLLVGVRMVLRETLIAGRVARAHKEVVATGVSQANACPYCITVHAMMLGGAGQAEAGEALLEGGAAEISHP